MHTPAAADMRSQTCRECTHKEFRFPHIPPCVVGRFAVLCMLCSFYCRSRCRIVQWYRSSSPLVTVSRSTSFRRSSLKSGKMRPEDSGGDSTCSSGAHPRTNSGAGCSYPLATDHGGNDGISADHTTGARAESHGQTVDVPTPQIQEEIAVIQVIPQERVSERILEQTGRCSSPSDSRTICRNLEVHPTRPGSAAHGGADCCSSSSSHREHAPNDVVVKVHHAKLQRVSSEDCRTPVCRKAVKQSAETQPKGQEPWGVAAPLASASCCGNFW